MAKLHTLCSHFFLSKVKTRLLILRVSKYIGK